MQAGFATLSAGSIRAKNVKNILLKVIKRHRTRPAEISRTRPASRARFFTRRAP